MYLERLPITLHSINHPLLSEKKISLQVARFDLLHPVVSGNKFYKLHYFLQEAVRLQTTHITSFGGAYSNHLVATACACQLEGLPCTGVVRGEMPAVLSPTLQHCQDYDMALEFMSRSSFADHCLTYHADKEAMLIPEGGYHPLGAAGAALMYPDANLQTASHICLAVGTATTLAGILQKADSRQQVIAVPVLKGLNDMEERLQYLNGRVHYPNLHIWPQYHFGGYAKKDGALLRFMNELYEQQQLPTDFVYTAKMLYAVWQQVAQNYFAPGSTIICLHTGGLQGNRSLAGDSIIF